jgi:5-oxoprolinase (ATP-hydrolysing) subunit A
VPVVDLNADLGESYGRWQLGDDEALLPLVTSANVACGFHAGDPLTLRHTVAAAVACGVVVGAQVSFPDLVGFGRRDMDVAPDQLEADVLYQLSALDGITRAAGSRVRYLKAHGALYHRTLVDEDQARAVVRAVTAHDAGLCVLTTGGSAMADAAQRAGLRVIKEGYADRAYDRTGDLVPRSEAGAVLHDVAAVTGQAVRLATSGDVDSICLHGDTPDAVALAAAVRAALTGAGISLQSFA